jgi:polycystin 1L2
LGITVLPDNNKNDRYFYQIIVFTGHRKNAATQSKVIEEDMRHHCIPRHVIRRLCQVHFVLSGDSDETRVRTLTDPHRKVFQRGGIDGFIMAVPK